MPLQDAQSTMPDEIAGLRAENSALRLQVRELLGRLDDARRAALVAGHTAIVEAGQQVGEEIPFLIEGVRGSVDSFPSDADPPVNEVEELVESVPAADDDSAVEASIPTPEKAASGTQVADPALVSIFHDSGVPVVLEVERDETLVFKFGSTDGKQLMLDPLCRQSPR